MNSRQSMARLVCIPTLLLAGAFAKASDDLDMLHLVQNGKTDYAIVRGASASEAEAFAATELASYLEKATGTSVPVIEESKLASGGRGIYVGWTDFAKTHGIEPSKLDAEEWIIQSVGKDLILTGGRPVGSLYAVYEFLETKVGCRWLDRDTEVVPHSSHLAISCLKVRGKPAFWQRSIYTGLLDLSPTSEMLVKEGLFLARNKSTQKPVKFGEANYGAPNFCHTFHAYSKDFPADHPEYFSMDGEGKRVLSTSGSGPGGLCLSNPEVRKLLLAQLKKFIAQDCEAATKAGRPTPRVYDISQNDDESACLCPSCKAITDKEGSASGLLLDCINELADGVKAAYPDVMVMTDAYKYTLKTPKHAKPRDNVIIRLAQLNAEWAPADPDKALHYPDYFRPMSHPINGAAYKDIAAWSKLAKHLAIWDYWVIYLRNDQGYPQADTFPTPYVNTAYLQSDLQLLLRNRVESIFAECEYSERSSFQALKLWLGQKLLQDPNQPVAPLVKIFMEGYYGSASPQMTKYLSYLEKQIAAVPATIKLSSTSEHLRPYLTLKFFTTVHDLLAEAEKRCGTDANSLLHVRQEWIQMDAAILNMWPQLERQLTKGRTMPFDRDVVLRQYVDSRNAVLEQSYGGKLPAKVEETVQKEINALRVTLEAKHTDAK